MSNWFLISLGLLVIIVLCFYGSKLKPIKEGWNPKSPSARVQHDIDLGDKINPKTNKPRPAYFEPEIVVSPFPLHD